MVRPRSMQNSRNTPIEPPSSIWFGNCLLPWTQMWFFRSCIPVVILGACTHHGSAGTDSDAASPSDGCDGIQCFIVDCGKKSLPPTTVSGTVYAPNGTLPLYGVTVYVPAS